jgi:RNA polymerase sigma-70 factor, ECF subfamily
MGQLCLWYLPKTPADGMDSLLEALRQGNERAFETLIEQHQHSMVRLAAMYVHDDDTASDVVQETWIAVLKGLDRFEGRSSLKTWIFSILVNRAKTRAQREGRNVHFVFDDDGEPAVPVDMFDSAGRPGAGWWRDDVPEWKNLPEDELLSQETGRLIRATIDMLPPLQRQVILLRDIDGWNSDDVCNVLEISETNQRVLLHRARTKVRMALNDYMRES